MSDPWFEPSEANPVGDLMCSDCDGWGKKNDLICSGCDGSGYAPRVSEQRMVIAVTESALEWRDSTGTKHYSESLCASTHTRSQSVHIRRSGEIIGRGFFQHVGTHGSYDAWVGFKSILAECASSLRHSELCPGDEIHIIGVPVTEQVSLWREMQSSL
jgi:hypothetical protein